MRDGGRMTARRTGKALLFVPGDGALHRANPFTKLVGLLWVLSATAVLPVAGTALVTLAGIACAFASGVGPRVLQRALITLTPLAVALAVVHGFLIAGPDGRAFGPLKVSPHGLLFAATILCRIAAVLTGSLLFVTTTHPGAMLRSLDARGVSPGLSYLLASPLLLLEPLSGRARDIRDAQRARGLDLTSNWRARILAVPVLLIPLITLALTDLDHRVLVLSGRAFRSGKRRTVLDAPPDSNGQVWLRRAVLSIAVLQLGFLLPWR